MSGAERREQIIAEIKGNRTPISATRLAEMFDVSRQVIVQDIALIRASGYDIFSTNRGYIINTPTSASRVFKVRHTDAELRDELESIVDLGGCVENVMINHKFYGTLKAVLDINSRRKVDEFLESIHSGKSSPLKNITSDYHYHRISAESEICLDIIEQMLKAKGFLVEPII